MKTRSIILILALLAIQSVLLAQSDIDARVVILGPTNTIAPYNHVFSDGHFVYAAGGAQPGFEIIDTTTFTTPRTVGSYTGITTGQRILIQSNIAYWGECCVPQGFIAIADISNPTQVVELSRQGGLVSPRGICLVSNFLFVADYSTFRIYDVTEPTNMTPLSATAVQGYASDIVVRDGVAFLATAAYGFEVFSLTNIASPAGVGALDLDIWATDLRLQSNLAYVTGIGGLRIIDITLPTNPVLVGAYSTNQFHEFAVSNDLLVASAGMDGIQILSIATPTNPVFLASTSTANFVRSVSWDTDRIYAADPFTIASYLPLGAEAFSSITRDPAADIFRLYWVSAPGRTYSIQSATSLVEQPISWSSIGPSIPATPPLNSTTVSIGGTVQFISLGVSTNE